MTCLMMLLHCVSVIYYFKLPSNKYTTSLPKSEDALNHSSNIYVDDVQIMNIYVFILVELKSESVKSSKNQLKLEMLNFQESC